MYIADCAINTTFSFISPIFGLFSIINHTSNHTQKDK